MGSLDFLYHIRAKSIREQGLGEDVCAVHFPLGITGSRMWEGWLAS